MTPVCPDDNPLTNLPQSHNISANQIRQDANARRAAALASQQAETPAESNSAAEEEESDPAPAPVRKRESKAQSAKRKREEVYFQKLSNNNILSNLSLESHSQDQSFQEVPASETTRWH